MCYARRQRSSWARIKLSSKLYLNLSVKTLVSRACLALYTLLSMSRIRDRFEILFSKKFRDSFASSFCLYFDLLLFNCQWSARFSPLLSAPCFAQPEHYITAFCFCQGVFQNFFQVFFDFFQAAFPSTFSERMWSTLYHIHPSLSRGFSKVFSTFLWSPVRCLSYVHHR